MYAIIRAGGKQAKVRSGDVIEIERVKGESEELTFSPLLVVDDEGNAVSDRDVLAQAKVKAKVLGESMGPKIDIFKYKSKSGYRRRQGHRQKYTQIEITGIELPGSATSGPAQSKPAATESAASNAPGKAVTAKSEAKTASGAKTEVPETGAAEEE